MVNMQLGSRWLHEVPPFPRCEMRDTNIALLLPESPYPPRCGNAWRDVQQITLLKQMGFSIRLLLIRRRADLSHPEQGFIPPGIQVTYSKYSPIQGESRIRKIGRKIGYLFWSRQHAFAWWTRPSHLEDFLSAEVLRWEADVVIIRSIFSHVIGALRQSYSGPVIIDCHDADVHLATEAVKSASPWRRLGPFANLCAVRRACRSHLALADEIWAVSAQDAQRISSQAILRQVVVVPSAMEDPNDGASVPGQQPLVVMVANYGYGPNANGARWLVEKVWPSVLRTLPLADLEFVGANMPPRLVEQCRAAKRVKICGQVEDLQSVYCRAAVIAVPILEGSGTRLKIIEAWRQGKAVLTTTKGIEGLDAPEGCAAIADDPSTFANKLVKLLSDHASRVQLGNAGQSFMRDRLSYSTVMEILGRQSLLAQLAPPAKTFV